MTDERALLAAMAADPADDTIRLAYADLLEETGDYNRAEFVRVQVELARMNPGDPLRRPLVVRNRELLREHGSEWEAELSALPGIEWGDFSRGLVEEVQAANEAAIVRYAKVIFAQPAVHVIRLARLGDARALAKLPELDRVRALRMVSARAEEDVLRDLLASPHLSNLIVIDLHGNRAGDDTATDIADGRFPALTELWLGENRIGIRGAMALASSLHLGDLQLLDLRGNLLDLRGDPHRHLDTREKLIARFGRVVKLW